MNGANAEKEKEAPKEAAPAPQRRVLADGTYATQSAFSAVPTSPTKKAAQEKNRPPLRRTLIFFYI